MSRKYGFPIRCGAADRAASTLEAAVTADMIMSVSRTASAADNAIRTPIVWAAAFNGTPAVPGNKISQTAIRSIPASRNPEAIACPASPKPMKETRGVLRRVMAGSRSLVRNPRDRRRALGVERFDRLQSPGLSFPALGFGPADRLPVRRQHKACASAGHLDPVAAGFVHIKKEGLLDRVFVRPRLNKDSVLEEDISSTQHVLARIERERDVVQASLGAGVIARIGEIVTFVGRGHPHSGFGAVIEHNLLRQHEAEIVLEELPVRLDVDSESVEMIDTTRVDPARRIFLSLVFERGFQLGRCVVPFGLIVDLEFVAVGILENKCFAVAEVSVVPADVKAGAFQCGGAPLQCLRRAGTEGSMAKT